MKSPPSVSMEDSLKHLADRLHASPSSNAALIQKALSVGAPQEVVLPLLLRFVCKTQLLTCRAGSLRLWLGLHKPCIQLQKYIQQAK